MTTLFQTTINALQAALKLTSFSASKEEVRYYLNGVYITPREDGLEFVSTDGHRLSHYYLQCEHSMESADAFIIPNDGIARVLAVKPHKTVNGGGEVSVTRENEDVTFALNNGQVTRISTRPIAGTFPDYNRVLPPREKYSHANPCPDGLGINLIYVADVANAVKKAIGKHGAIAQVLHQAPDEDGTPDRGPVEIHFAHSELGNFRHIIMPCRF